MTVVDHVIVCVGNLDDAVSVFERQHRVSTVEGGRHRGQGTANRLVPLGDAYVELVAVVDPDQAASSSFGRWVKSRASTPGAHGLALRTDDLDGECRRLGIEPISMSRPSSTGEELSWRIAGLAELVESGFPFFIEWDIAPGQHPGRIPVHHPGGDLRLTNVTVRGDADRLAEWMGDVEQVRLVQGEAQLSFRIAPR